MYNNRGTFRGSSHYSCSPLSKRQVTNVMKPLCLLTCNDVLERLIKQAQKSTTKYYSNRYTVDCCHMKWMSLSLFSRYKFMHCILFPMFFKHKCRWRLKIMRHYPIKARLRKKTVICYSYLGGASHILPLLSISVFKRRKLCKPKICQCIQKTTPQCRQAWESKRLLPFYTHIPWLL